MFSWTCFILHPHVHCTQELSAEVQIGPRIDEGPSCLRGGEDDRLRCSASENHGEHLQLAEKALGQVGDHGALRDEVRSPPVNDQVLP